MKRIITAFLFLIPWTLYAQPEIKNISLTTPDSAILYTGVENKMEVSGVSDKAYLRLKSGKGEVKRNTSSPSVFNVRVSNTGSDAIEVYESSKLVLTKPFEVRALADPVPMLAHFADSVAVDSIVKYPTLNILLPGCYYKHEYSILYFFPKVLYGKGKVEIFYKTHGNRLNDEQTKFIKRLKRGDKIVFTEIMVTCPGCQNRRLRDLTVVMK
ncbi:MAG: GldM family protein [Bacteroidia bacterium]